MKNLCNILKSKKIRQQNIPSINHPYIQNNNKNIIPSISITSYLPRIKPTNKRKTYNDDNFNNN